MCWLLFSLPTTEGKVYFSSQLQTMVYHGWEVTRKLGQLATLYSSQEAEQGECG